MLHSIAKVSASLNLDGATNSVVERFSRRFQILGYHKVSPDAHPFFPPMHPEIFEKQMQFLKSCYKVMGLQELVKRAARGDVPERAVAITFDDGYRDNYEYAFPILRKHQFPATIFVATGAIGTGNLIWHDRVFDAFRFAAADIFQTEQAREAMLQSTLLTAKKLHGDERRRFIDDLESKLQPTIPADVHNRMLNWEQVREMHDAGIEFGSHTVSHTIVSCIPRSEIVKELRESKNELSDRLGTPVASFAYPNGKRADYNEEAKSVLRECGYSCAVTCCTGFNHASSDVFELKRGLPWQQEIDVFRFKLFLQRHGLAS